MRHSDGVRRAGTGVECGESQALRSLLSGRRDGRLHERHLQTRSQTSSAISQGLSHDGEHRCDGSRRRHALASVFVLFVHDGTRRNTPPNAPPGMLQNRVTVETFGIRGGLILEVGSSRLSPCRMDSVTAGLLAQDAKEIGRRPSVSGQNRFSVVDLWHCACF